MTRRAKNANDFRARAIALLFAIPAVFFSADEAAAQANFFGWHTDLNTAAKVSTKTGKPIFLVFRCVR